MANASWNDHPESELTFEDVRGGAKSKDGFKLLSGSLYKLERSYGQEDGMYELIVWDTQKKERIGTFFKGWTVDYRERRHDGLPIDRFRFSADEQSIITVDQDGNEETFSIVPKK